MNRFLKSLQITFRRDPTNLRPRINKLNSQLDKDQKSKGNWFFMEGSDEEKKNKDKKSNDEKIDESDSDWTDSWSDGDDDDGPRQD